MNSHKSQSIVPLPEMQAAMSRRRFIGRAMTVAASGSLLAALPGCAAHSPAPAAAPGEFTRKVKLGIVGCGGRGRWLSKLFQQHGGYEIHAVADYFPDVADALANTLSIDKARRFSGLSGYKKLIDSGVEAVAIEDVPYFYAEQAKDSVSAGLHVYMAKPVAVDVPGCLAIEAAGKQATDKKRCFLVDYQLPHDPACIEVANRIRDGALGKMVHIVSFGLAWQAWPDPPIGPNIESRLRDEIWLSDTALSGDTIVSYDIHIIDGIIWVMGKRPVSACGCSRTCRPEPHGDRTDSAAVVYEYDDGTIWTHVTQSVNNNIDITSLSSSLCGTEATAHLQYGGKNYVRGGQKSYSGTCDNIFPQGAICNIADFYKNITEGHFENLTIKRAVDGTLAAILGREAAARRRYLTMQELIKENNRLEVNLSGLKA